MLTDITHSFQSQTADSSFEFVLLSPGCEQMLDKKSTVDLHSFTLSDEGVPNTSQGTFHPIKWTSQSQSHHEIKVDHSYFLS